jgi:RNA polymerase sigma factor (sigma-70 family)
MAQMSDDDIVQGLLDGGPAEDAALRWMYKNLFPMVLRHISTNSGDADDAKDVFQDALFVFAEHVKRGRFQRRSSIATFLMAIVRNAWHNRLRRRGYSEGYVAEMKHVLDAAHEPAPDVPDPGAVEQELAQLVQSLIGQLGEKCREILRLRFWDGFKMEHIATVLAYKNGQIAKNKHFRCLEELRALLSGNLELRNHLRGLL